MILLYYNIIWKTFFLPLNGLINQVAENSAILLNGLGYWSECDTLTLLLINP